uniref:PB1-like domain-containing protein n=1 Tax=Solanum lycopersicum TaxID=4081 RepID=A0A3Q7ECQ1_SOLLC
MVDKVDLLFYYGGKWVLTPNVIYIKKFTHVWKEYDPDLLSYIDICEEFHEKLGFSKVQQLLLKGPSETYYLIEGDSGIRTIQTALSIKSGVLELFAVDEGDDVVPAIDISHNDEPYLVTVDVATEGESSEEEDDETEPNLVTLNEPNLVTVNVGIDVATEGESSEEENNENEPYPSDYNSEELESFRLEKKREINDQLDNFKELEKVKKGQGFEIKTLQTKHTCPEAFKNRRATQQALAHYFKNRVQNDPNCKVTEMRKIVDDNFNLNISYSKMKRVKRLVLEKLDGSYVDDFNKLEGYAQELRDSNPGTDALKSGWRAGLRPFIGWCAKHIEANWSKSWSGVQMKKMFWWYAWSTYGEEFEDQLKSMGSVSKKAVEGLLWYPPQHWCRAFFDTVCKNYSCENNFTESFNKWILEARAKPIIKMLEDIRIKVMKRLKKLEEEEPLNEMHWWYSKEAYLLVYQPKMQPVRGEKFWKIDLSQSMQPPQIHKLVGRPKLKRVREKDEARKREGLWSKSRKGLQMTCGNCSAVGHNRRRCPLLQEGRQVLPDEPILMPTLEFVASSSRQTSHQSSEEFNEVAGPSKSKRKNVSKDKVDALPKRSKNDGKEKVIAPLIAIVDRDEVEDSIESEDENTILAPRVISEEKTRLQMKKMLQQPIGSRMISYKGDENGVVVPTNLPYSPKKLTWKGKACVTSSQLNKDKEKKIGKLKAKRGKH